LARLEKLGTIDAQSSCLSLTEGGGHVGAKCSATQPPVPAKATATAPPPSHEVGLAGEHYVAMRLAMVGITPTVLPARTIFGVAGISSPPSGG